jgi:hypothetical protein
MKYIPTSNIHNSSLIIHHFLDMAKKFDNLSSQNKNLTGGGIQNLFRPVEASSVAAIVETPSVSAAPDYIRHTVMFFPEDLEFLKNVVYAEKRKGNVNYSQKEALHEAIEQLRKVKADIVQRPDEVVEYEKQRSRTISKGKNA